jgi:translation initiation factor IF-2
LAKNLKIKIKNTQLAEALKLNKLKSSDREEVEKPPVKEYKAPPIPAVTPQAEETSPAKPPVKATAQPTLFVPKKAPLKEVESEEPQDEKIAQQVVEESTTHEIVQEIPPPPPVPEVRTVPKPEWKEDKAPEERRKIGSIRPGTEKRERFEDKKVFRPAPTPVIPVAAPPAFEEEKIDPVKKKKEVEVKAFVPKPVHKKPLTGQVSFDSRARQGLQGEDEGIWRRRKHRHKSFSQAEAVPIVRPTELKVKLPITIKDLAAAMKLKASDVIAKLFMQGVVLTLNDFLDDETTTQLIGHEFGCAITIDTSKEERLRVTGKSIKEEIAETVATSIQQRSPIIVFMGHVDHGKTSLIDAIRKSNRVAQEAGAITQHMGAFRCKTTHGYITVLDTPGHEAFSSMRTRGSGVTDLVVLVIAGDEGIKPQTDEAIKQARDAGAPIVVAINKCDKPGFNADDVYRQLADRDLLPESWGGPIITVNCSAVTKQGINELLEMVSLQSEILELKANPEMRARGTILESELKKGLGATATLLVQNGTLRIGDALVIDHVYGKVKTMHDDHGKNLKEAGPSFPVKITGLSDLPEAGCEFIVVENEKEAKKLCIERRVGHEQELLKRSTRSLENLLEKSAQSSLKKELRIILKADVQGSLEAIKQSLSKISSKKADVNILASGIGDISESDVELAGASNALIIGFHTNVESHADSFIKQLGVKVKMFDVIYHLIDDVKKEMVLLLDKVRHETYVGTAEVRMIFKASTLGLIAGCQVTDGIIKRNHFIKVHRGNEIVFQGHLSSLKRVQEDVKEVSKGLECGILLQNFSKIEVGDLIKSYDITFLTQEL